jgi:hypothetical protein
MLGALTTKLFEGKACEESEYVGKTLVRMSVSLRDYKNPPKVFISLSFFNYVRPHSLLSYAIIVGISAMYTSIRPNSNRLCTQFYVVLWLGNSGELFTEFSREGFVTGAII